MINKKLINTGAAAEAAFLPSQHFDTVTYTGNGGTQRIGGYINRGAVFNGSSSKIDLSSFGLTGAATRSFSFWVKPNATPASFGTILFYGANSNGTAFQIYVDSSNQIYAGYFNRDYTTSGTVPNNTWSHVVVTSNGGAIEIAANTQVYINGTLQTLTAVGTGTGVANTSNANYSLGYRRSDNNLYFNGCIDQVRIFNKVLSSSEVTTLYGETTASTSKSVTDIFNDDSGVALYQLDGNANDTGGVSGKFGSAAIFNGSSSYIDTNYSLPASSNFSFSFWFTLDVSGTKFLAGQTGDSSNYFHIASANATLLEIQIGSVNYVQLSVPNMADGNWHHLVISRSAGSGYTAYLDNSSVGTFSNTAALSSANFFLGARDASHSSSLRHLGKIDQVRIYSSALSSSDVTNLYNETSVPTANLVAHYKFDGDARDEQQQYDGAATNVIYAYDGTATNVTYQKATDFQPDLVWIKSRSLPASHGIYDSVRGAEKWLRSDFTNIEQTQRANGYLSSFDSNGFTLEEGSSTDPTYTASYETHQNGQTYVAWCLKGGGTAVSNTNGTITSQVSANQAAGFSIVKFPTTATNVNVGHGLSQAPEMIIYKNITYVDNWYVYHKDLSSPNTQYLNLNTTSQAITNATNNFSSVTLDTFTSYLAGGGDIVCYCFHSVEGYSKIGSYTGTGAAGNAIVTGFQPAFVMIKRTDSANDWYILDSARSPSNSRDDVLYANLSNSESVNDAFIIVDFLSNGFELQGTSGGSNASGGTYIYLAIAADPDVTQPVVENSFDVVTYTGTSSTQTINTDFKPDLVWIKSRSNPSWHSLQDSVRGATKTLFSNTTNAEITYTDAQTSFDSNGFTLGADVGGGSVNVNGRTYVAWCWKAGDHDDNLPQINTNGTIDSIVSVNPDAGFSIVKWYNASGTNQRIGHGLSSAPELTIYKATDATTNWYVGTTAIDGSMDILILNTTAAKVDDSATYLPTSSTITSFNFTGNWISYCFHSVDGYQKIGNYSGTGASGQTITTGFQPRFLMVKAYNTGSSWFILDSVRNPNNPRNSYFRAEVSNAEANAGAGVNFLANSFEFTGQDFNDSGVDWIYLAIA